MNGPGGLEGRDRAKRWSSDDAFAGADAVTHMRSASSAWSALNANGTLIRNYLCGGRALLRRCWRMKREQENSRQ